MRSNARIISQLSQILGLVYMGLLVLFVRDIVSWDLLAVMSLLDLGLYLGIGAHLETIFSWTNASFRAKSGLVSILSMAACVTLTIFFLLLKKLVVLFI